MSDQNTVHNLRSTPPAESLPPGGGGGGGGDDQRLNRIEERLDETVKDLAKLSGELGHIATKADLNKLESTLMKWGVGLIATTVFGLLGAIVSIVVLIFRVLN